MDIWAFTVIYVHLYFDFIRGLRGVWRYQRGNQNSYIEEEQTTQGPKEKVQRTNNDRLCNRGCIECSRSWARYPVNSPQNTFNKGAKS